MRNLTAPNYSLKTVYRDVPIFVRSNGTIRNKYAIKKRGGFKTLKLAKAKIDFLWAEYPKEMGKAYPQSKIS
jgi:hypothetical protein